MLDIINQALIRWEDIIVSAVFAAVVGAITFAALEE